MFRQSLFSLFITFAAASSIVSAEVLKDPTRPPGQRVASKHNTGANKGPRWKLTSTFIAPHRRVATINGRTIEVGGRVNGAELIDIQPSQVVLRKDKRRFVVRLVSVKISKEQVSR